MTALAPLLSTRHLARTLVRYREIGSTNDRALRLSKQGASHGLAIVADAQTAGRGQRGRAWRSAPGSGLYASFVLRPRLRPPQASWITLAAGVGVLNAVQPLIAVRLGLKWPNDVLVAEPGPTYGRKLAGLLFDVVTEPDRLTDAVLGIGINLRTPADPALAMAATSLDALGGAAGEPVALLARVANHLEPELDRLEADGFAHSARAWTEAALGLGARVEVHQAGGVVAGELLGIDAEGALSVRTPVGPRPVHHGRIVLPGVPRAPDLPPAT